MSKLMVLLLLVAASLSGGSPRNIIPGPEAPLRLRANLIPANVDLDLAKMFPIGEQVQESFAMDEDDVMEEQRLNNLSVTPLPSADENTTVNFSSTIPSSSPNLTESTTSSPTKTNIIGSTAVSNTTSSNTTLNDKDVIIPTTKPPAPYFDTIIEQAISRLNDTYTLSILLPVTAGFVFASVVIVLVAFCNCIRKRCCKRRFRRKVLPESLRNMRQSDREKLLAETSDEEF